MEIIYYYVNFITRVSTGLQNLDLQTDALTQYGCVKIFPYKMSGSKKQRPGLEETLQYARQGDTIQERSVAGRVGVFCIVTKVPFTYAYQKLVKKKGITMSMSRKGTPADNSPFKTLLHTKV